MIYFIYCVFFIVGAILGSFSNMLIYRLPRKISLINPSKSTCFVCNNTIKPYDNVPIISYLVLKGKCRYCKTKIPIRDFFVELCNALLYVLIAVLFLNQSVVFTIVMCLSATLLIIIACIDLDFMLIPNSLLFVFIALSIVLIIFYPFGAWYNHLIGCAVGGGFLLLIYGLGFAIVKREVVGLGDVKLMATLGLLLGWKNIIVAYLIAFIVAGIVLLIVKAVTKNKEKFKEYPFAPFLALGALVAMFCGEIIINGYLNLFV